MKASDLYKELGAIGIYGWKQSVKSKVDETKCLPDMLEYWKTLLKHNPDMTIGSIMKYNIEKDFPNAFRDNDHSTRPSRRLSTSKS